MPPIPIRRVDLGNHGRLRVHPSAGDFSYIYRDASSVRWDASDKCLLVLSLDDFSLADEYAQIIGAVRREYGTSLILDNTTVLDLPEELAADIRRVGA